MEGRYPLLPFAPFSCPPLLKIYIILLSKKDTGKNAKEKDHALIKP
jgi:hypothetical protein